MNIIKSATFAMIFAIGFLAVPDSAMAQKKKKKNTAAPQEVAAPEKKSDKKSIAELVKGHKKIEGLFTFYQDTTSGELKMLISKDQIDKEFIYFSQVADGVTEASAFRGSYMGSKIFKIERYFNRVEFVSQNTAHYFDPNSPLVKSSNANISHGVMASAKIEGYDEKSESYLIKADNLFLKETFSQIKRPSFPGESPFPSNWEILTAKKPK